MHKRATQAGRRVLTNSIARKTPDIILGPVNEQLTERLGTLILDMNPNNREDYHHDKSFVTGREKHNSHDQHCTIPLTSCMTLTQWLEINQYSEQKLLQTYVV